MLIQRNPEVLFRELGEETVLFHPDTEALLVLDRVGALIWGALIESVLIDDLVDDVASVFGIDRARATSDLSRLVEQMRELDLVIADVAAEASVVVDVAPAAVEVTCGLELVHALSDLLPVTTRRPDDWIRVEPTEHGQFRVMWEGETHLVEDIDGVVSEILSRLNYCHIRHSPSVLHLHAGAVVGEGYTVVISGASRAGKSTLVAGLCERGHTYVTDECVDLDEDLGVTAWAKPISLREGGRQLLADASFTTARFAKLQRFEVAARRTIVVVVDASLPEGFVAMRRTDALHRLVDQSLDFGRRAGDLGWLGRFVAKSAVYSLGRGPLDAMCHSVTEAGRSLIEAGTCEEVDVTRRSAGGLGWHAETEAVIVDGSLVLFNRASKKILTLEGSTAALIDRLGGGSSAEDFTASGIEPMLLDELAAHGMIEGGEVS